MAQYFNRFDIAVYRMTRDKLVSHGVINAKIANKTGQVQTLY